MSRTELLSSSLSSSPPLFLLHFFLSVLSVACRVPVIVSHLNELVDHVQQVVVVFFQQPLVKRPVTETHLHQHSHHGVLGGRIHWRLCRKKILSVYEI